jgi:hypothetical protein
MNEENLIVKFFDGKLHKASSCPKPERLSKNFFAAFNRPSYLRRIKEILPENPTCAEIGVFRGDFSEKIMRIVNPKKLYLIDPWIDGSDANTPSDTYRSLDATDPSIKGKKTAYSNSEDLNYVKERFSKEIDDKVINIKRHFSYDIKDDFEDSYFDFIYVDATHTYESVLSDLNDYLPKLKSDGILAGHDFIKDFPGVKKAVNQFAKENKLKFLTSGRIIVHSKDIRGPNRHSSTDWALVRK